MSSPRWPFWSFWGPTLGQRLNIDIGALSRLSYHIFGPAFIFSVLAGVELETGVVVRLVAAGLAGMAFAGPLLGASR
ncbi:MAG: hypothetical protein AAEB43_01725 [Acidimicrobiales bacterium]|jgi:hypothetical protein